MVQAQATVIPADFARQIYTRQTSDPRVCVVDGWGIKLTVERGHLQISDGIAATRRTRAIPRIDRTVRRIVITGREGYISLAALRWCREHRIAVVTVDPYGELVAVSAQDDAPDAPTIRAQALCGAGGIYESTGLAIARMLTDRKLHAQAETCWNVLGRDREAREIRRVAQFLDQAQTMQEISRIEAEAGQQYWSAWSEVSIAWTQADLAKIPAHWAGYSSRKNPLANGNRDAIHPVNAILNYAYRMLEIEARLACIAAGLHPAMGFQHADRYDRDSLVADLMECARPVVDQYVLSLLDCPGNEYPRRFGRAEFTEAAGRDDVPAGTVRLVAPLTHEIAEQSVTWARSLYPVAEQIARMIATAVPGKVTGRTITTDKVIMAKRVASRRVEGISTADVISDRVWALVASLAEQLPYPASSTVAMRDVAAALIYSRARRVRRTVAAAQFGMSEGVITRRWADWRDLDAWHKLETVVAEHANRSPSGSVGECGVKLPRAAGYRDDTRASRSVRA